MVIRLERSISAQAIEELNHDFADLLNRQPLHAGKPLRQERDEPELSRLPRLICGPHRRNFGRMRQLIDAINGAELAGLEGGTPSWVAVPPCQHKVAAWRRAARAHPSPAPGAPPKPRLVTPIAITSSNDARPDIAPS